MKNITNGKHIATKEIYLESILAKAIGLMFSSRIHDSAYIFIFRRPMKIGLHMFFVFYPIDVLFLDEKRRVVDTKQNFRPFTFYNSQVLSSYVVELPAGAIKTSGTKKGDLVDFTLVH